MRISPLAVEAEGEGVSVARGSAISTQQYSAVPAGRSDSVVLRNK